MVSLAKLISALAAAALPGVPVALSTGWALPQLASRMAGDRMAARRGLFVMLSATPENGLGSAPLVAPLVAGVDEAGRGPLAGPVVAAAVVLCKPCPTGLGDSKVLSAKRRAVLETEIRNSCAFGIGVVDVEDIDRLNIFAATMFAMTIAVERLEAAIGSAVEHALIDGNMTPQGRAPEWRWPATAIVKGDAKEPCISAASIIAKEYRDRLMREAATRHPHYGWERNAGYGTREHMAALHEHGVTPLHRKSFAPVAQLALL